MFKRAGLVLLACGMTVGYLGQNAPVFADESVKDKVSDHMDETKKGVRKSYRKAKKKHRDGIGHSSITEDTKDTAANAGDEISTGAKKLERKTH